MENKFKVGDLVVLKSGGPTMTVMWWEKNDEAMAHTFRSNALKLVRKD